jgi:hypothetical protein
MPGGQLFHYYASIIKKTGLSLHRWVEDTEKAVRPVRTIEMRPTGEQPTTQAARHGTIVHLSIRVSPIRFRE